MSPPDDVDEFDDFADLDEKLDEYFGEVKKEDKQFAEMTQQFFKGSADMDAWDNVDATAHKVAVEHGSTEDHVDEEWEDFADAFFSDDNDSDPAPAADKNNESFAPQNQTIRFDMAGGPSAAGAGLEPKVSASLEPDQPAAPVPAADTGDKFNLFLRKIAVPKQRDTAVKIIAEVKGISEEDAETLTKKPFIKVLIGVSRAEADAAHARFREAGLVSTIKKCT